MRRGPVLLLTLVLVVPTGGAAPPPPYPHWTELVVPDRTHDFGTVARGSRVRHAFRIVNTTSQEVHIADYRTRCGCTDVKLGARSIPPGTQTTIDVTLDTSRFSGYKPSGLTVLFDRPDYAEVDLTVTSFIHSAITLEPGQVDLGTRPRGTSGTAALSLAYRGDRPSWKVTGLTTGSDHVSAEVRELPRPTSPGGGVQYQIAVTLKPTAPAGSFRDEIVLETDDPATPSIPISVSAEIQPSVSVAPSSILNLGRLRPGQEVQRTVLVKSAQSFRITATKSARPDLSATGTLGEARAFHTLTVSFTAPATPGPYNGQIEIVTDLADEPPARLLAFATIVP
jgi:hypothetical protein